MNYTTLTALAFANEWYATCPKCGRKYGPEQLLCSNCGRRMLFFRETHSSHHGTSGGNVTWTECGFACLECGVKYKSFNCEDDDVVIKTPRVMAYLPSRPAIWLRRVAGLSAFFVSLGAAGNLLDAMSPSEDAALVVSYSVAVAVTVVVVKSMKTRRWLSYEQ